MLSRIGIILVVFYFALFGAVFQVAAVDYKLPSPGILPDNPIYFLKVVRDKMILNLIPDKNAKGFYALLLADKRLAAGEKLWDKGNRDLAVVTFMKGEDYFKEAVDMAQKISGEDLKIKLVVAAAKHQEVLQKAGLDNSQLLNRTLDLLLVTSH